MREGKFSIIPHLQTTNLSERIMCLKNYCKYSWQLRMWQRVWQTDLPQLLPLDFFVGIFVAQPCGKTICHTKNPRIFVWQKVWQIDLPQLLPLDLFVGIFVAQSLSFVANNCSTNCQRKNPVAKVVANRFATPFATRISQAFFVWQIVLPHDCVTKIPTKNPVAKVVAN